MAIITFNPTQFRALFPLYANTVTYPNMVLQLYWDTATAYISNKTGGCYCLSLTVGQQTLALNLMTAHLAYLNTQINAGNATGVVQGATIDKVSVQIVPPPNTNNWQYWLNQSPFGQQLLALLQAAGVGGCLIGGYPTVYTLRR